MTQQDQMARSRPLRTAWIVLLAIGMALSLSVASSSSAEANPNRGGPPAHAASHAKPDQAKCSTGRNIPINQISIQLWTFNSAIGQHGIEHVIAELADMGYRKVEPFNYHGLSPQEFKDLLDEYGMKVDSRHGSTNEANWDTQLEQAKLLGQKWMGSGGFAQPGIGSYENTLATAETLNRLGERSVKNGTGKVFGHNHANEFTTTYVDVEGDGTEKSAWQIIVENTDPRWVTFQLDVGWADRAGEDSVELLHEFGDRIELLHVKDFVVDDDGNWVSWVPVGDGVVDWAEVFRAARGNVRSYIVEQDFPPDAFVTAERSFDYLDCLSF
jgi:sugar phosphate isomerase/epimerase